MRPPHFPRCSAFHVLAAVADGQTARPPIVAPAPDEAVKLEPFGLPAPISAKPRPRSPSPSSTRPNSTRAATSPRSICAASARTARCSTAAAWPRTRSQWRKNGAPSLAVNINAIPRPVVDRGEIRREGAFAIHGADAAAGVINNGVSRACIGRGLNLKGSVTQQGGANESELTLAGRLEPFSIFGQTTKPKANLGCKSVSLLKLRASDAASFRALGGSGCITVFYHAT